MKTLQDYPMKEWEFNPTLITYKGRYVSNWFSNMHQVRIISPDDGIEYPSVEHYFQAHKTSDIDKRKELISLDPYAIKRWARDIPALPSDWNDGLSVMQAALYLKWTQSKWKDLLLSHPETIVEWNNWRDYKWGVPIPSSRSVGKGRNILGIMLMEIRDSMRSA